MSVSFLDFLFACLHEGAKSGTPSSLRANFSEYVSKSAGFSPTPTNTRFRSDAATELSAPPPFPEPSVFVTMTQKARAVEFPGLLARDLPDVRADKKVFVRFRTSAIARSSSTRWPSKAVPSRGVHYQDLLLRPLYRIRSNFRGVLLALSCESAPDLLAMLLELLLRRRPVGVREGDRKPLGLVNGRFSRHCRSSYKVPVQAASLSCACPGGAYRSAPSVTRAPHRRFSSRAPSRRSASSLWLDRYLYPFRERED